MSQGNNNLDHLKFDPKYNLQMMFELLVEIIALQQATNKVLTERLYGEDAVLVEHEIFKACADLKPRIMESLYAQFGKTPAIKPKKTKKPKS
jgi:ABC-type transporter MlaC component